MLKIIYLLISFILISFSKKECARSAEIPRVNLPSGVIEGHVGSTVDFRPFFKFEGVPYAKPPVGELRYEDPQDVEPWIGIFKANTLTTCLQYDHFLQDSEKNYIVHGDEDCLHVNIYTPTTDPAANLNVLVHIHGGAFMFGSGSMYGPNIIMSRNIVFVNLNYRLGTLGFLCTEDDVMPGNLGIKDQIKALEWIKANIKYFGGNPDTITLHGFSAGGASVHLHYMLEEPKNLFVRGFSHSASALNPWVLAENTKEKTKKVADLVGCPSMDSRNIKNCLKTKSARQIVGTVKEFQPFLYNPFSPFGVVIDGQWASNPILRAHPYQLLKEGKILDVPWIVSYAKDEGLYPSADFWDNKQHIIDIDTKWNDIIPFILHYNETVDDYLKDSVSQQIRKHYIRNANLTKFTYSKFIDILTDRLFISDIGIAAKLHNAVTKSNVYSYYFAYRGTATFFKTQMDEDIGVSHGDDTIYILNSGAESLTSENDKLMSKTLIDIITCYMQTGSPLNIPNWTPLLKSMNNSFCRLVISGPHNLDMQCEENTGEKDFWYSLPLKENANLFKTYGDEL